MSLPPPNPFKGLQPYGPGDEHRLFGRDKDLVLMKDRIFSARTTLLFAGSGVGKTSFLNAKVIPELETRYRVFYHNRWAGPAEPLEAVKGTLAANIEAARRDEPLLEIFRQFRDAPRPAYVAAAAGDVSPLDLLAQIPDDPAPDDQCLLIFDQFEEIFQYHAYEDYFKRFLDELCGVIGREDYRVHVVFSMREEFLGELSVFDNRIPDLFNNYYRLKYPDLREARQIIEGTCWLEKVKADKANLKTLISDLSKIEKGAAGAAERSTDGNRVAPHVIERSFIIPPYLQVACHGIWEEQAAKAPYDGREEFVFLADYRPGQAQRMLHDFCIKKLSGLTFMEKNMAAQAFDFLVTKQGAKMAYEFKSLADHMRVMFFKGTLERALMKLSAPDTRVLRRSHGPDGSVWYELYHDIYGKILDAWKQSFRKTKLMMAAVGAVALALFLALVVPLTLNFWVWPRQYQQSIREAKLYDPKDYRKGLEAYEKLRATRYYETSADSLWAQAWERRARYAEGRDEREEAFISWLKAASVEPDKARAASLRREAAGLVGGDYRRLRATLHQSSNISRAIFSADGQVVVTQSIDQQIRDWDADTGAPRGEPFVLSGRPSGAAARRGVGGQAGAAHGASSPAGLRRKDSEPSAAGGAQAGGYTQQQHQLQDAALHSELGLIVATIPASRSNSLGRLRAPNLNIETRRYAPAEVSIWRRNGELVASGIAAEARLGLDSEFNVRISHDGKYVATAGRSSSTRLWEWRGGTYVPNDGFRNIGYLVRVRFSPDGRYLLAQTEDERLHLWETASGKFLYHTPGRLVGLVNSTFGPDGSTFLTDQIPPNQRTLDKVHNLRQWDTESGKATGRVVELHEGEDTTIPEISLARDDKILVYRSDRVVGLWDAKTGKHQGSVALRAQQSSGLPPTFRSGGEMMLLSDGQDARLIALSVEELGGKVLRAGGDVTEARLSDKGQYVVGLWKPTTDGQPRPSIKLGDRETGEAETFEAQVWDGATAAPIGEKWENVVAVSDDGRYLAVRDGKKGPLHILDAQSRVEWAQFPPADVGKFVRFAVSASGKYIASASSNEVYLWQKGESRPIFNSGEVSRLGSTRKIFTFSPDERYFAYFLDENEVATVLNLTAPESPVRLDNPLPDPTDLAFSANGRLIAGGRATVRVWDLASGRILYNTMEHTGGITSVALTRDGKTAVTGQGDGVERLWKLAENGQAEQLVEVKHEDTITSAAFSEDGRRRIIGTRAWVHVAGATEQDYQNYLASYYVDGEPVAPCRSTDDGGERLRCVVELQDDVLKILDFSPEGRPETIGVEGSGQDLLDSWLKKLWLDINERGQVEPRGTERREAAEAQAKEAGEEDER